MIVAYIGFTIVILLWVSFFSAMLVASIMDWQYRRKNKLFLELQQDYNKPRRPAAK
jgi:hypothetical protein